MKAMRNRGWIWGIVGAAGVLLMAGGLRADDGRLVIASGTPDARQLLVLDPASPGDALKLGPGEGYLPESKEQGLISAGGTLERVVLGTPGRKLFAKAPKLANAGQLAHLDGGNIFVISQGNKRIIEFYGRTGKLRGEHFLEGFDGGAMAPRGLVVLDQGLVAIGADGEGKEAAGVFVYEPTGDNAGWYRLEVKWPDKKEAVQPGQLVRVSGNVAAFVDGATLRVIELEFTGKDPVKCKTAATLTYAQAAGATGLAYDPQKHTYYVGCIGKDTVLGVDRATGQVDAKISPISVTDPTFLLFTPIADLSVKEEPASTEPAKNEPVKADPVKTGKDAKETKPGEKK
jgi:hypothetical protein